MEQPRIRIRLSRNISMPELTREERIAQVLSEKVPGKYDFRVNKTPGTFRWRCPCGERHAKRGVMPMRVQCHYCYRKYTVE